MITAIVVLQLVEAGQLGLDDPVGERLAAHVGVTIADPAVAAITVRQLLVAHEWPARATTTRSSAAASTRARRRRSRD